MKKITTLALTLLALCLLAPQGMQAQNNPMEKLSISATPAPASVKGTMQMNSYSQAIPNENECKMIPQYDFTVCCGTNLFVVNTTIGPAQSFRWDWGDGHVSYGPDPVEHSYDNRGDYYVTLTIMGECGATSMTRLITME